ncbi:Crp/Fnr family transcriptional regulator [Nibrella viscosa]|uniref:Crp/Fnr family transcriptional regulator n=1 Tax=Nibrella viscosa TaxID=1084524 RepID=A0ABP8KSU0_9BACT
MTAEAKYWYLRNHPLFAVLTPEELRTICAITSFRTARRNEMLYFSEEEDRIFFLIHGTIKIVDLDEDGTETVKELLHQGDAFGQVTLDYQNPNEYAVVLTDYVTCCSFRTADFERVIRQNPLLALQYTKLVGQRFRRLENRYANLMGKDVRNRFILFLREWAKREGKSENEAVVLKNYLTHQDIALLIRSTRQTVTQLFGELKQEGLLDYSRRSILLSNSLSVPLSAA